MVDLLNISIQAKQKFLNYYKSSQFYTCRLHFILFISASFAGKPAQIHIKLLFRW